MDETSLPPKGYEVVSVKEIDGAEVSKLYEASDGHPPRELDPTTEDLQDWIKRALVVVGVRNEDGQLVGIGFLDGTKEHAILDGMVVHPDHRHRGLGSFLVKSRVEKAKEIGIHHLKTTLTSTNSLTSLYEELGVEVNPSEFEE